MKFTTTDLVTSQQTIVDVVAGNSRKQPQHDYQIMSQYVLEEQLIGR
jgi:hypothetical protein